VVQTRRYHVRVVQHLLDMGHLTFDNFHWPSPRGCSPTKISTWKVWHKYFMIVCIICRYKDIKNYYDYRWVYLQKKKKSMIIMIQTFLLWYLFLFDQFIVLMNDWWLVLLSDTLNTVVQVRFPISQLYKLSLLLVLSLAWRIFLRVLKFSSARKIQLIAYFRIGAPSWATKCCLNLSHIKKNWFNSSVIFVCCVIHGALKRYTKSVRDWIRLLDILRFGKNISTTFPMN
jgi:hypothetical protein